MLIDCRCDWLWDWFLAVGGILLPACAPRLVVIVIGGWGGVSE